MDTEEIIFVKYECGTVQKFDDKYVRGYVRQCTEHSSVLVNILEWMDHHREKFMSVQEVLELLLFVYLVQFDMRL